MTPDLGPILILKRAHFYRRFRYTRSSLRLHIVDKMLRTTWRQQKFNESLFHRACTAACCCVWWSKQRPASKPSWESPSLRSLLAVASAPTAHGHVCRRIITTIQLNALCCECQCAFICCILLQVLVMYKCLLCTTACDRQRWCEVGGLMQQLQQCGRLRLCVCCARQQYYCCDTRRVCDISRDSSSQRHPCISGHVHVHGDTSAWLLQLLLLPLPVCFRVVIVAPLPLLWFLSRTHTSGCHTMILLY